MKPFLVTLLAATLFAAGASGKVIVRSALVTAGLSERVYEPGVTHVGIPILMSGEPTQVINVFDTREHLDPSSLVTLILERSTDGGITWVTFAGIRRFGGPNLDRQGNQMSASGLVAPIGLTTDGMMFRNKMSVTNSALRTSTSVVLDFGSREFFPKVSMTAMPDRNYDPGDYSFGPIVVPGLITRGSVVFDTKDRLQPDSTMTVELDRSFNGGITWEPFGGVVRVGGATKDKTELQGFPFTLPEPQNTARLLRGRFTLRGGTLKTAASIVLEQD
jgi:hypothetical protein